MLRAAEGLVALPFVGHAGRDVAGARERPLARRHYTLIYRVVADRRSEGGDADIAILRLLGPGQQVTREASE